jgi:hypothetical protein
VSSLFPRGVTSLGDLPFTIHEAIVQALQFLAFEEMPKDERPKRAIWLDPERLKKHFEAVEKRREEKYSYDKDGQSQAIEDPVENEAAKMLIADG